MHAYLAHHTEFLQPRYIQQCNKARTKAVDGLALIVNWQSSLYRGFFDDLRSQLQTLFGEHFQGCEFLHSDIVRMSDQVHEPMWQMMSELDLSALRMWFDKQRITLSIDHTVINEKGEIQLVFRDNHLLPQMREQLAELESDLPISAIEEDELPLLAMTLGYFTDIEGLTESQLHMAESLLGGWIFSHFHQRFYIQRLELVEFKDESWQQIQLLDSFDSHFQIPNPIEG